MILGKQSSLNGNGKPAAKPSVHYQLFMYQEELRRRDTRQLRLNKSKIRLTDRLISESTLNLHERSDEDLRIIYREMTFKKHLQKELCMKFYQKRRPLNAIMSTEL